MHRLKRRQENQSLGSLDVSSYVKVEESVPLTVEKLTQHV